MIKDVKLEDGNRILQLNSGKEVLLTPDEISELKEYLVEKVNVDTSSDTIANDEE